MTLASYVLVVSDDQDGENARAGLLYMVMAHAERRCCSWHSWP